MSLLWNRRLRQLEQDNTSLREELSAASVKAERECLMKEQALRENAVLLRKNRELNNRYESVLHLRYEMERIFNEIHTAAENGESLDKKVPKWLKDIDEAARQEWGKLPRKKSKPQIPKCGITFIDMLVETSVLEAQDCGVSVSVAYIGNATRLIAAGMSERDAGSVLSDLIENAVISAIEAGCQDVRFEVNAEGSVCTIDVYDSGEPFDAEVLRSLGKEKVTTHPGFGEGGISLLVTLDILKKCKGSFVIDETPCGSYKKRVSVRMDGLSQFVVVSSREDVKRVCEARQDILLREPE